MGSGGVLQNGSVGAVALIEIVSFTAISPTHVKLLIREALL
jgi:hypothetical protein